MIPVAEPATAIAVLLLLQVPPVVAEDKVLVAPRQMPVVPVIDAGAGLTVRMADLAHPVEDSVNIMLEFPAETALMVPLVAPMVATVVLLLLHVPAPDALVSVADVPAQSESVPPILAGRAITVTTLVVKHPVDNV
jgi:hypothetical protein